MIIIGGGKILSIFANIESIAPPMLSILWSKVFLFADDLKMIANPLDKQIHLQSYTTIN